MTKATRCTKRGGTARQKRRREKEKEKEPKDDDKSKSKKLNEETRQLFFKKITSGEFDDRVVEIEVKDGSGNIGFIGGGVVDESMMMSFNNMMSRFMPARTKKNRMAIKEA